MTSFSLVITRRPQADVVISRIPRLGIRDGHVATLLAMTFSTGYNVRMRGQYCVYIITNKPGTVLYTGVTNDLKRRIYEHRVKIAEGFSKKYNLGKLIYYETVENVNSAIAREKQIKDWSRRRKMELISGMNPHWQDLYDELV